MEENMGHISQLRELPESFRAASTFMTGTKQLQREWDRKPREREKN